MKFKPNVAPNSLAAYSIGQKLKTRRLLTHAHEHMGQMITYLRFNGISAPWPDWRPDRRTQG